jgi:hypothetical protein
VGGLRRTIEAWRKNEGDWVPEISANIPEPTVKQIYSALTDLGQIRRKMLIFQMN